MSLGKRQKGFPTVLKVISSYFLRHLILVKKISQKTFFKALNDYQLLIVLKSLAYRQGVNV